MNANHDSNSGPSRRRSHPRPPLIAWAVLIAATLALIWTQYEQRAVVEPAEPDASLVAPPDMDLLFGGRLAVGAHHLLARLEAGDSETAEQWLDDLHAQAATPADRLRVLTVRAELEGGEAVETELAELAQDAVAPDTVRRDAEHLLQLYREANREAVPSEARQELVERHAWFGRLALAFDQPADDPERRQVINEAVRTVVTLGGVSVVLIGAGVLGLVLFVLAIVGFSSGWLRWHYRRTPRPTGPFLETMAIFLAMMAVLSVMGIWAPEEGVGEALASIVYLLVAVFVIPLVVFWPLLRGVRWRRWLDGLGLHRGQGVFREIGSGVVGYVAGLPIVGLGLIGTLLLTNIVEQPPTHPFGEGIHQAGLIQILLILFMAVVWAPVVEELTFRGAFYHHMRRAWSMAGAAVVIGLVFAVIHPQGLAGVPVLASLGVVFALMREWRGSIVAPMTAHALHNFGATLVMLLMLGMN